MMPNPEVEDQAHIYQEYFKLVKSFNSANTKYLAEINDVQKQRQTSVERAIKAHIDPFVSNLRGLQVLSSIVGGPAGFLLLVGLASHWHGLLLFLLFAIGIIGLVGLLWTLSKINSLVSDTRKAKENLPKLPNW
jgi:VIT1/CCC1 family predicted Fe2+/Mn2+ transporter